MHKGYAFVQFTNPFDARSACLGEDGRTVLGQTLGESPSCISLSFRPDGNKSVSRLMQSCPSVTRNRLLF
jgi:hypothetical protein